MYSLIFVGRVSYDSLAIFKTIEQAVYLAALFSETLEDDSPSIFYVCQDCFFDEGSLFNL